MGKMLADLAAKEPLLVVGLTSGAAGEEVEAALCELSGGGEKPLHVRVTAHHSEAHPKVLREALREAAGGKPLTAEELTRLHFRVGQMYGRAGARLLEHAGRRASDLDLAGSHGETVCLVPPQVDTGGGSLTPGRGLTLQLGEAAVIAERLGVTVVSNFRARDIAAGGQGGPLTALVDHQVFAHPQRTRAVVHIGALSSITWLPAGGGPEQTLSFYAGPGSLFLSGVVQRMTMGQVRGDPEGTLAAAGEADTYLLREWLAHPYFQLPPPKSPGPGEFGWRYAKETYESGVRRGAKPADVLRTAAELVAGLLAGAFRELARGGAEADDIIVSGPGAAHPLLMASLKREAGGATVCRTDELGIPARAKDAMVMAVLARETVLGRPGNVPTATGAAGPRVLGQIALA